MRVGYACVNAALPSSARTTRLANLTSERIDELVGANLDDLESILRWNERNGVQVFRLTSNLVPFGSHVANDVAWWELHAKRFAEIGALVRRAGMRLSTHPGQYTVLSSKRKDVVRAAVAELEYHDRLLASFGSHKIVIHVGSGSADASAAADRFAASFARLSAGTGSGRVRTRRQSTSKRSPASSAKSETCPSTASWRSRTRSARCCAFRSSSSQSPHSR